jgi:hypothetical protein
MESSIHIGQFETGVEPASTDGATTEVHPTMVASIREQCSACGAAMASDQRYCVECGERRGPARVPLMEGIAQGSEQAPTPRRPSRRAGMSVNSTLIAGIGTLLLAMGIGVLIGRTGNTSAKTAPAQVVTVAGAGPAATGTTASAPTTSSGSPTSTTKASGGHPAASSTSTPKSPSKKAAIPPPKPVTVGTPGHGPGYENGKFTGNFFK